MTEALTISPFRPDDISLDYDRLRAEGIEHLEQLAVQIWTDFNAHDPGITVLEVLCYAITDLGYRTNLPIEDLLAGGGENSSPTFFSQSEVLPSLPYTAKDYRKLFIDVAGVKNAWVHKYYPPKPKSTPSTEAQQENVLNGLYEVLLELPDGLSPGDKAAKAILARVQDRYRANRNLGEDLQVISVIRDCPFCLCLELELEMDGIPTDILAAVMFAIQEYCAPHPRFHSFQELLEAGVPCADILNGPPLKNGFLPDSELDRSPLRKVLYRSDLIRIIMETPGVKAVNSLAWKKAGDTEVNFTSSWCLDFNDCAVGSVAGSREVSYQPYFDLCCSKIKAKRGTLHQEYTESDLKDALDALSLRRDMPVDRSVPSHAERGVYRPDLDDYESIQYEFPENYAVGDYELPENAPPLQQAQRRQLQAYLAFFDQILAGYLRQLAGVRDLLSIDQDPNRATYLHNALLDVPGLEDYLLSESPADYETMLSELTESSTQRQLRRNQIMDHLLARFGEQFTTYSLQLFASQVARENDANTVDFDEYLNNKAQFLRELPTLSSERGKAYNYKSDPVWNSDNVAGLKKRVVRTLGLETYAAASVFCDPEYILNLRPAPGEDDKTVQLQFASREERSILLTSPGFSGRGRVAKLKKLRTMLYPLLPDIDLYKIEEDNGRWRVIFDRTLASLDFTGAQVDGTQQALASPFLNSEALAERLLADIVALVRASDQEKENFHLLEHILLRPNEIEDTPLGLINSDCFPASITDQYSFVVTVALPNWTPRFQDSNYQLFVEQTFRREAPAHVYLRFCWLDRTQMRQFEERYKGWREAIQECSPDRECNINEKASRLIEWLNINACVCNDFGESDPPFCPPTVSHHN